MEADRANIIAAAAPPFNSAAGSEGNVSVASSGPSKFYSIRRFCCAAVAVRISDATIALALSSQPQRELVKVAAGSVN
jgi:hypothetical protein